MTAQALLVAQQVGLELGHVAQDDARMLEQRKAGRRRRDALLVAVQQVDLQHRLEIGDAPAHRRDCDVLLLRGLRDALLFHDGHEELQGQQIETQVV